MKTFAIFLLSKETFTIRTCSILESFFRKLLSKATFKRKLSGVSLPLVRGTCKSVNNCTILIARTVGAIYFCTVYAIFGQNRACNVV